MAVISRLLSSPCGRYLAAATHTGLHTFSLGPDGEAKLLASRTHPAAPAPPTHITAMAFLPGSSHLLVATSESPLALMPVATLVPEAWLQRHSALSQKLAALDGAVTSLAVQPASHTPTPSSKRKTATNSTDEESLGRVFLASRRMCCMLHLDALKAGAEVSGFGVQRPPRQRAKPVFQGDPEGAAARLWPCEGAQVVLGATWPEAPRLVVIEGDRDTVRLSLPPPLDLKLYGE